MTYLKRTKTSNYISSGLLVLLLMLVPAMQSNLMQLPAASAAGGITLNNVQSTSGTVSSSPYQITISSFNAGTGSNQLLVVGVEADQEFVNSVTFGGVALTKEVSSFHNNYAAFWYLVNPSGTGNIVVTMNGATSAVVGAYAFSGIDQTTPIPTTATNYNSASSSPTVSITTQYSNSWVLDSPAIYGGQTLGSPTCTQEWNINIPSAITGASSSTTAASPGSVTCSWSAQQGGDLWDDAAIEVKAATGNTTPGAPTSPTSTALNTTAVKLGWTAPSSNGGSPITGYQIQKASTTWATVVNNTGNVTSYMIGSLAPNSVQTYRIGAWNSIGLGAYSSNDTAVTIPGSPTGLTATAASSSQINLGWTAPSGNATISGYKIERSTDGGSTWSVIDTNTGSTSTSYSDTGLSASTTYTYRVSAINSVGTSSPSNTASATTLALPSATTASTGIVLPLYCDPYSTSSACSNSTAPNHFNWQGVENAKKDYSQVPIFVKINPNSGPGSSYSSAYGDGIGNLTQAGVVATGYVPTGQCTDSLSTVETEIDDYKNWYQPHGLTGISFDEMPNTAGCETYYTTLSNYAKNTDGFKTTIGNPGGSIPASYIGTVDRLNIYENSGLPSISTLQGNTFANSNTTGYDKHNFTMEPYSISSIPSAETIGNFSNYVGLMDVTDDGPDGNPWDQLPTYLNTLASDLDKSSEIVTINAVNGGGSSISGEFVTAMQSGNQIPSGSAPLGYNGTSGVTYTFVPQNTSNCIFDHWQDTMSTTAARAITVGSTGATYTAVYKDNGANTCQ